MGHDWPMKRLIPRIVVALSLLFTPVAFAEETDTIRVSEFTFSFGKPWLRQQASSPMRAGQFLYEHQHADLGQIELVIFHFGAGQGGGVQANIDRWVGMFDGSPESSTEEREAGDRKVTLLSVSGTYMESAGGPFSGNKTARPDYTMLAAILPSDQGDVFIRLTGPTKAVDEMKEEFDAFAFSPFAD